MEDILGIDLGTTNSCVAVMEGDRATVLANAEGNRTTPSVVAFTTKGERLVGELAKRQALTNAEHTIFAVKRLMGQPPTAPVVGHMKELAPYPIVADGEIIKIQAAGRDYLPEEISAAILQKMRETAERKLGHPVKKAIVTVPAYFNDSQRLATRNAGRIAGLDVLRIINEPTAAALAYRMGHVDDKVIAVYDLGGGTFDISILDVRAGVFKVVATAGNTFLGGDDFDFRIMKLLASEFKRVHGVDLFKDAMAMQRLRDASEEAKVRLSSSASTDIELPFIAKGKGGVPLHLTTKLDRAKFDELVKDLVDETFACCDTALKDSGLKPEDIDEILPVGGQTRSPIVLDHIERFFGKAPVKGLNPDEAVATGAAIQGGVLLKRITGVILVDVTPMSLGIEITKGQYVKLVDRNTPIPARASRLVTTVKKNQTFVTIHVLQGEGERAKLNHSLGKFDLVGLPPLPAGEPQILVGFQIDANGIFKAGAKDLGSGREQAIRISGSCVVPDSEIERMVIDAETAGRDARVREEIVALKNRVIGAKTAAERAIDDAPKRSDKRVLAALAEAVRRADAMHVEGGGTLLETLREDVSLLEKNVQDLVKALEPERGFDLTPEPES
ncbi:MAG: molecular chaperone DnaK [bacterium]